jgi:hypothetical protein
LLLSLALSARYQLRWKAGEPNDHLLQVFLSQSRPAVCRAFLRLNVLHRWPLQSWCRSVMARECDTGLAATETSPGAPSTSISPSLIECCAAGVHSEEHRGSSALVSLLLPARAGIDPPTHRRRWPPSRSARHGSLPSSNPNAKVTYALRVNLSPWLWNANRLDQRYEARRGPPDLAVVAGDSPSLDIPPLSGPPAPFTVALADQVCHLSMAHRTSLQLWPVAARRARNHSWSFPHNASCA